jgi:hypothetical protein
MVPNLLSVVEKSLISLHPDGNEVRAVMQQSAMEVDQAIIISVLSVAPHNFL